MRIMFLIIMIIIQVLLFIYVWKRLPGFTTKYKIFRKIFLSLLIIFVISLIVLLIIGLPHKSPRLFAFYFYPNLIFVILLVITFLFSIFYGAADIICFIFQKLITESHCAILRRATNIIVTLCSIFITMLLIYGYIFGSVNYKVKHFQIVHPDFPEAFNGIRIAHISDLHLGSFMKKQSLEQAIYLIRYEQPDMIVFTGDLVNIAAEEALLFIPMMKQLHAPLGKFAVLGNHDMSDYMKLDIKRDSCNVNTTAIIRALEEMGFTVLCDSAVNIVSDIDTIIVYGTLPIGSPPFKAHGNIQKLIDFINKSNNRFLLLLTHHPEIWDKIVQQNHYVPHITFAGHTHAAQIGINTERCQFSPASIRYTRWYGHHTFNNKHLFISPGLGFIGIPVRLGYYPEIFIITINNK